MRPSGRPGELFAAFSRITAKCFSDNRLLSCPTLSKAPNYGQVLRRFLLSTPVRPLSFFSALRIGVRYILTNGGHLAFLLLSLVYLRLLRWKLPEKALLQAEKKLLIIDSFAVLPKIAQEGSYQELYLPGLASTAMEAGHEVVQFHRLYGSRNPVVLWRACKALASSSQGVLEAHLFTTADWARLFWHCLCYPFALRKLIRSLTPYPQYSPESYIREALVRTAGQCVILGEARRLAGYRLNLLLAAKPFACPAATQKRSSVTIVSWYENQTINKCLQRGLADAESKSRRHVPVIGAQLFLWPDTLLNNHPDDSETALGLTPDRILVNGAHFLPESTHQNYAVGPSLRYRELFTADIAAASRTQNLTGTRSQPSAKQNNWGPGSDFPPLLVLLSYHSEEVRRVLQMLLPLANKGTLIFYKFHPATQPERFITWLPPSPSLIKGSLKDALKNIQNYEGIVLGSGSGSLAEAVVYGIPVLTIKDSSDVPGLSLEYLPEYGKGILWDAISTAEDVEKVLKELMTEHTRPDREALRANFRTLLFSEPTPARIRQDFGL